MESQDEEMTTQEPANVTEDQKRKCENGADDSEPADKRQKLDLTFNGQKFCYNTWEEKFLTYLEEQDLKSAILSTEDSVDAEQNKKCYEELMEALDENSKSMMTKNLRNNGIGALKALRTHYQSDCILLIGNIEKSSSRYVLENFLDLKMDIYVEQKGKNRGYACAYTDKKTAERVLAQDGAPHYGANLNIEKLDQTKKATFVVKGMPDTTTDEDLVRMIPKAIAGHSSYSHIGDPSKGYGFVDFPNLKIAMQVMTQFNGKIVKGRQIFIEPTMQHQAKQGKRRPNDEDHEPTNMILVRNLSYDICTPEFEKYFKGHIGCRVVAHNESGKSKGFGFVKFNTIEEAIEAKERMSEMMIDERIPEVVFIEEQGHFDLDDTTSKDAMYNKRSFDIPVALGHVQGLSMDTNADVLKSIFAGVSRAKVIRSRLDRSKGEGFLEFDCKENAEKTVKFCNGKRIASRKLTLAIVSAEQMRVIEHEALNAQKPTRLLQVKGLTHDVSTERIMECFPTAIDCSLPRDPDTGKGKGFAFVLFKDMNAATDAKMKMMGKCIVKRPAMIQYVEERNHFRSARPDAGDIDEKPTSLLVAKNISYSTTQRSIYAAFPKAINCRIPYHRSDGSNKRFAFVEFQTVRQAMHAKEKMDGEMLDNEVIRLYYSHHKDRANQRRGERGTGGGGGAPSRRPRPSSQSSYQSGGHSDHKIPSLLDIKSDRRPYSGGGGGGGGGRDRSNRKNYGYYDSWAGGDEGYSEDYGYEYDDTRNNGRGRHGRRDGGGGMGWGDKGGYGSGMRSGGGGARNGGMNRRGHGGMAAGDGRGYEGYEGYEGYDGYTGGYDASTGGYDASTGSYDASTGGYDASTGGYDATTGGYNASTGGYDASTAGYDASTGGYDASTGGYNASTGGYDASTGGYDASTGGYDASTGTYKGYESYDGGYDYSSYNDMGYSYNQSDTSATQAGQYNAPQSSVGQNNYATQSYQAPPPPPL